jgi:uncharacterized protein YfaS (alpha-2-macroglobulin family)
MGKHPWVRGAVTSAVLMLLLTIAMAALPQSIALAQSRSASIISLNTDKASYYSGDLVTIALVVRNTGDSATQVLCNIVIINPAGEQAYGYSRKYDLSYGATSSYEFYWTVPYNAVTGTYQVQSTIADGKDGRYYSSRSTSFIRNSPIQSPRSAALLDLSVDKEIYLPGQLSTITVFMQNTGGSDITVLTAVDVVNPSGIQVYNGVRESRMVRGYTDKAAFALPIPDNAGSGTYQVQATIADKIDGKLYGSKSATLYVQPSATANVVVNKSTSNTGIQLPNFGITGWGQYLITGLLIALAAIVIYILIRNRTRKKEVISESSLPESTSEEEKPEEPL